MWIENFLNQVYAIRAISDALAAGREVPQRTLEQAGLKGVPFDRFNKQQTQSQANGTARSPRLGLTAGPVHAH